MKVTVLPLDRASLPALQKMWRGYQEFYQVSEIDDGRNREHIEQILAEPSLGRIHLAVLQREPIGFSTIYYTFTSTRSCKVALLNDLYVIPSQRRSGVGRQLIDHALELAHIEGIRYVRWSTASSNADAQRLYDSYATPTLWQMYSVDVSRRTSG